MFTKKGSVEKTGLEQAIDKLLMQMDEMKGYEEDYASIVAQLDVLYKLQEVDHKISSDKRVSKDTLAIVAGNLAGILLIVGHERAHVVTSKALNFMLKFR